jgi:ubiquitin C-terminal hydrolase
MYTGKMHYKQKREKLPIRMNSLHRWNSTVRTYNAMIKQLEQGKNSDIGMQYNPDFSLQLS